MMDEALCVGGPLDGKKREVASGQYIAVPEIKAVIAPAGAKLPAPVIEHVEVTITYRLENFRSRDKKGALRDVFFYFESSMSTHEALLKLIEGYKP